MKKFRVPIYCERCKKLLGYKSYSAEVEREEPERYCATCSPASGGETPPPSLRDTSPESTGTLSPKKKAFLGEGKTAKELKAMAKAKGVKGYTKMSKDALMDALQALEEIDG